MFDYIRDTIYKILVDVARMWLSHTWSVDKSLPLNREIIFFVYPYNMEWREDILQGKRVRITMKLEDWSPDDIR